MLAVVGLRKKHFKKDNKTHILKHLHSTATCLHLCNSLSFKMIDKINSKFDLKIKEALHINWRIPKCTTKSFSPHPFTIAFVPLVLFCLCFVYVCVFLFHLLFSLSLTSIIDFFYCLNYTSPLLHLITTHFVSHFSLSPIIFIISMLIISIFYYLNYTSTLLHLIITHLVNIFYNNYAINRCPRQLL